MLRRLHRNRAAAVDAASLIIRLSLTVTLVFLSISSDTGSPAISVTAAMLGCLIGSGLLTRAAAAASLALMIPFYHDDPMAFPPIVAEVVSLILLGAGTCSVDALVVRMRIPG